MPTKITYSTVHLTKPARTGRWTPRSIRLQKILRIFSRADDAVGRGGGNERRTRTRILKNKTAIIHHRACIRSPARPALLSSSLSSTERYRAHETQQPPKRYRDTEGIPVRTGGLTRCRLFFGEDSEKVPKRVYYRGSTIFVFSPCRRSCGAHTWSPLPPPLRAWLSLGTFLPPS